MFGAYETRFRVVYVVGFWGGPKLEANVRRLNPSATGFVSENVDTRSLTEQSLGFRVCE